MSKIKECGLQSRFYRQHPVSKLMTMTDEEIMELVDQYLDTYIDGYLKRNKGQSLPAWSEMSINDIRNKKTNISKSPVIITYKKKT